MYTKEGTTVEKKQKDRLQNKGVTHLHLKKDSIEHVRKYKIQKFLSDKIKEFEDYEKDEVS